MIGNLQIGMKWRLSYDSTSWWALCPSLEYQCFGLQIHFITPLSLGRLWAERDFSYCKDYCISKTIKILSKTLMILTEIDFSKQEHWWIWWGKNSILCTINLKIWQLMKIARYGIKMLELATAAGILLVFMIYQGNIEPGPIQPTGQHWLQTEWIPLTMMGPYLDRVHNLTIDNWYTTLRLAKYHLHRSARVVGTVRSNRNNFPKDFLGDKEMQKGSAVFKEHENMLQWNTEELRIKQLETK